MDFADIGRADVMGDIQRFQRHNSDMAVQQQNMAVQDLNMTVKRQEMEANQRAMQAKIEEEKKLDQPLPLEILKMKFEGGGEEGSPGAEILKLANARGYIDTSQGGIETISERNLRKLKQEFLEPEQVFKTNQTRINWGQNKLTQAKEMLSQKPDDPKAQAAFQQASNYLTRALGADKDFKDGYKQMMDAQNNRMTNEIRNWEYGQKNSGFNNQISQPDKSLTVDLYNPQTDRKVRVQRGTDDYNAFLEIGYEEGTPNSQTIKTINDQPPGGGDRTSTPVISLADAKKGTGVASAAKQFLNNTIGQLVPGQIFPETEEARNNLRIVNQNLRSLLKVSRAGSNFDISNIDKMLVTPDSYFQDPDAAKTKFENIYTAAESSVASKRKLWENAGESQRKELASDIMQLEEVLSMIPAPGSDQADTNPYSNLSREDIKSMDTSSLSPEQKKMLIERIDQLVKEQN